ncbi:MAG: sugar transferase [Vicingaceae bacterium]
MNKRLQVLRYAVLDFFSAAFAWGLFYIFRKKFLELSSLQEGFPITFDYKFFIGMMLIPVFWLSFYAMTGFYKDIYRKSRLKELFQTFLTTLIGVILIFFTLLLDDEIISYRNYYTSFFALFSLHFFLTFFLRFLLTTATNKKIKKRMLGFKTLIIGSNERALKLYDEIEKTPTGWGHKIVGFVFVNGSNGNGLGEQIPNLGKVENVREICQKHDIEEAIIAVESSEHHIIEKIVDALEGSNVLIKIIPDMYDILAGSVKMTSIFGTPLIEINSEIMPAWQKSLKRLFDIAISLFVLLFFAPLFLVIALVVRFTSPGPSIFRQERIGHLGKPFTIYKFRSMYEDAELNGPLLSSLEDNRITRFGKFMRRIRLDEMPQFYNVLIGDMSMVGPRPERMYFIDKIVEHAAHYKHLLKVKPGITSWGQVKYGYAENVDQMTERMKYDILYIENMSLLVDFKILVYTVLIVLKGDGK